MLVLLLEILLRVFGPTLTFYARGHCRGCPSAMACSLTQILVGSHPFASHRHVLLRRLASRMHQQGIHNKFVIDPLAFAAVRRACLPTVLRNSYPMTRKISQASWRARGEAVRFPIERSQQQLRDASQYRAWRRPSQWPAKVHTEYQVRYNRGYI